MASNAATNAVLLEVLNRHLENKPHEHAEITIEDVTHEIVRSELDFLVRDASSPLIVARVILTLRNISSPGGEEDQPTTELAAHVTTTPDPSSSSSTSIILDEPSQANSGGAHRASTIPTHPRPPSFSTRYTPQPLAETYKAYIKTFMANPATPTALSYFLRHPVTHNTRPLSAPEYQALIQEVRAAAIPDIRCEVLGLVVDEGRQVVAARLQFAGTMVGSFRSGVAPPVGGGGRPVKIPEIVFYWFDRGRIREVVSLVDMKGLGAQV
jgi:predicted ester cyclase